MAALTGWNLRLLGYWQLRSDAQVVSVGPRQQRLLAALAVLGSQSRHVLAGLLWPDSSEDQAANSIRVSVFHIFHDLPGLLENSRDPLALSPNVEVDVDRVSRLIREIEVPGSNPAIDTVEILHNAELLPGWYDDWVLYEQERLHQRRIAALERLAKDFLTRDNPFHAIEAARASISIEPLRESAQLILVRALLTAGDHASAQLVYRDYRARLAKELGVRPSPRFAELLHTAAAG